MVGPKFVGDIGTLTVASQQIGKELHLRSPISKYQICLTSKPLEKMPREPLNNVIQVAYNSPWEL